MVIGHMTPVKRGQPKGVVLGLTREEIQRLLNGERLHLPQKGYEDDLPPGWRLTLLAGDTEGAIVTKLRDMTDEGTVIEGGEYFARRQ